MGNLSGETGKPSSGVSIFSPRSVFREGTKNSSSAIVMPTVPSEIPAVAGNRLLHPTEKRVETGKQGYHTRRPRNRPAANLPVDSRGKKRGLVGREGKSADGILVSDAKRLWE